MSQMRKFEHGAVSLFLVIISALLITTMTLAFIRIMIQDQEQARANDLSKSGLDSAYAGVEDAKRLLILYRKECPDGPGTSPQCQSWASLMDGTNCDTLQQAQLAGTSTDREVLLKQNEGDEQLQQAYTCVKVLLNTPYIIGRLAPDVSKMVPLKGTDAFDRIEIEWFSQTDLSNSSASGSTGIDLPLDTSLPKRSDAAWPGNRPALMRLQLIQFNEDRGFRLSEFNDDDSGTTNNATLYLKPSSIDGTGGSLGFADNIRKSQGGKIQPVLIKCDPNFSATSTTGQYACKASITMPNPIGATDANNRVAYLRLAAIYNSTTYKLSLWSGANNVPFDGVQPLVDSTGRANDLFRRLSAHIDLGGSSIPQVEAAVDITGSLCKTFLVTDKTQDYTPGDCVD